MSPKSSLWILLIQYKMMTVNPKILFMSLKKLKLKNSLQKDRR